MDRYKYMDPVLQKINAGKVKLSEDAVNKNNPLLRKILDKLVREMKNDAFFNELYTEYHYGGSYWDGLKVGAPDEYDIDLKFNLHKTCRPSLWESSEFQGFVTVEVDLNEINSQPNLSIYKKLKQFLNDDKLDAGKLRSWFEGLLAKTIKDIELPEIIYFNKSGPAMTLHIQTENTKFDIDLVPCFYLGNNLWPPGFRTFPSYDNFFIIPKSPNESVTNLWRLSFQIQERHIINDKKNLKPTLRLLKVLRDNEKTLLPIKSYFIKTIFLWKLNEDPNYFENKSLGECFMEMLKLLYRRIYQKNLMYYWYPEFNLFVKHEVYLKNVTDRLAAIISKLENNDNPEVVLQFLDKTPRVQAQLGGNWNYHTGDTSDEDNAAAPNEWQPQQQAQMQEQSTNWGWWAGAAAIGVGAVTAALFATARHNKNKNNK